MEKGEWNEKAVCCKIAVETDLLMKRGNQNRVRYVRLGDTNKPSEFSSSYEFRWKITVHFLTF